MSNKYDMINQHFKSFEYYEFISRPNVFNNVVFNEVELTDNDLISLCIIYKACLNKNRIKLELDPVKLYINIINDLEKCIKWIEKNFMDFYSIRLAEEIKKEQQFTFSMILISLGIKEEPLSPDLKKKIFEKKINIEQRTKLIFEKTSQSFIKFLLNYYYLKDEFIPGYKNILQIYSELPEKYIISDIEIRSLYLTIVE